MYHRQKLRRAARQSRQRSAERPMRHERRVPVYEFTLSGTPRHRPGGRVGGPLPGHGTSCEISCFYAGLPEVIRVLWPLHRRFTTPNQSRRPVAEKALAYAPPPEIDDQRLS